MSFKELNRMKNKLAHKILSETPNWIKEKVREYALSLNKEYLAIKILTREL